MKYNEILKRVNKATTLKTVKKYADMLGIKLGNTKDVNKARNRVINRVTSEKKSIKQEVAEYKQKAFNKAKERYKKAAMKHNEKAIKMTFYGMQKLGKITTNVQEYLQGKELNLSQRSNITYQRSNTPFKIEDYDNIEFADIKSVNRRIKSLERLDKRLTKKQVEKELISSKVSKQNFENKLQGYVDAGNLSQNSKDLLIAEFDKLNALQQEVLVNNVVKNMPNKYPKANDEEGEEISLNLENKLLNEINNVSTYF